MRNFLELLFVAFLASVLLIGCEGGDIPTSNNCNQSDLAIQLVSKSNPTSCSSNNGNITVSATGGTSPYTFSLNGGVFVSSESFNNLGAGNFTLKVKDKNGCEKSLDVQLTLSGVSTLTALATTVPDTECIGNNGSIQINASGGAGSYQYKLNSGAYGSTSSFSSLAPGSYSISVKDADNCVFTIGVTVAKGDSQTSLSADVKPIIDANCAISSCHNGTQSPDLRSTSNIISTASRIKATTQSGSMPKGGSLTSSEKALIACWVDEGAKNN